jgi:FkbM family methyltransferase
MSMFHHEFPAADVTRPRIRAPFANRTDTGPGRLSPADSSWPRWLLRVRPAFVAAWLKKWLGVERCEVETPFGRFLIDPVSQFGNALVSSDGYEPEMRRTLETFVRPGSVFLDVGANEGFFSVLASRLVGSRGRVIAVEPQERLAPVIRSNLALNACANVSVFSCAISDRRGEAELHLSPDTNTGSTALYQSTRYRLPRVTVPVTTLADFVERAEVPRIDFVKMGHRGLRVRGDSWARSSCSNRAGSPRSRSSCTPARSRTAVSTLRRSRASWSARVIRSPRSADPGMGPPRGRYHTGGLFPLSPGVTMQVPPCACW